MVDNPTTVAEALKVIGLVFGGGGAATVLVAFINARRAPPPPPPPPPQEPIPIQIESAWFVQNVTRIQFDIERIKDQLGVITNQNSGIISLLKRRQARKPKH